MKTPTYLITVLSLLLTTVGSSHVSAFELNEAEKNIVKAADGLLPRSVKLLEKSVNINSGTMNFEGVKAVGKLMIEEFDALDFETEWLDGAAFNRAGHVVATKLSSNPNAVKILLIGHLDTVFVKEDSFQTYKALDQNRVSGPGITDMKGGDVIIIGALQALHQSGLLDNISVKVVMTGDEENSGRPLSLSKKALIDAGKWADIALGFEDGDSDINTALIARRGGIAWQLDVTGKPAHSSQIFRDDIGYGAIYEVSRILNQFRETLSSQENLTFNPGLIVGGTETSYQPKASSGAAVGKVNIIAKEAKVLGDIRALSREQEKLAQAQMQAITAQSLAHTSAKLTFMEGYPPMSPTKGNYDLLAMYSKASTDLGFKKVVAANPRKAGAADISFTAEHVDMALDGLGLMGCCGHTKDEVADMTSLHKNIKKAAVLMYRLSQNHQ